MKTKQWYLVGVLCAWLTGAMVEAQQPMPDPNYPAPPPIPLIGNTAPAPPGGSVPSGSVLSDWLLYNDNAAAVKRDCCQGKQGIMWPLYTELYVRAGPAVPVGGETLTRELKVGWTIEGGGRALFFNDSMTRAWTVDLHVINTNESGGRLDTPFPLVAYAGGTKFVFGSNGVPGVLVQSSNRTMGGLGFGREWYLWNNANSDGPMWRAGVDFGGRWGTHALYLVDTGTNPPSHVTDVVAGMYAAAHTDLEFPTRCGIFSVGFRMEWAYTFSDILQQNSNIQELNILATFGLRF